MHQPRRLRTLRFFDLGAYDNCFDEVGNETLTREISRRCYLPANALLLKLIKQHPNIRVAFSISGTALDQFEEYCPEVIESFQRLAQTGCVEFLNETYYHSLACLSSGSEFEAQVARHRMKTATLFGTTSEVFRNTELIYSHETGKRIHELGFRGVMIDGAERIVGTRSPHAVYADAFTSELVMLTRDYRLSDDIAFRYGTHTRHLTAARYVRWLEKLPTDSRAVVLGMDYETFGEHHRVETGIFGFMEALFLLLACHDDFTLSTPSEAIDRLPVKESLALSGFVSWADQERDISAWLGNDMQRDAFDFLGRIGSIISNLDDAELLDTWRYLQTSDHFYYMATKSGSDGEVHNYFSPYPSPYEAFINYMNALTYLSERIRAIHGGSNRHITRIHAETEPEHLTEK